MLERLGKDTNRLQRKELGKQAWAWKSKGERWEIGLEQTFWHQGLEVLLLKILQVKVVKGHTAHCCSLTCHLNTSHQASGAFTALSLQSICPARKTDSFPQLSLVFVSCPQFSLALVHRSPRFIIRGFDVFSFIYVPTILALRSSGQRSNIFSWSPLQGHSPECSNRQWSHH